MLVYNYVLSTSTLKQTNSYKLLFKFMNELNYVFILIYNIVFIDIVIDHLKIVYIINNYYIRCYSSNLCSHHNFEQLQAASFHYI